MHLNNVGRSFADGWCWSGVFKLSWWRWQLWLHAVRLRCRFSEHQLTLHAPGVTCSRCDYYALTPMTNTQSWFRKC